MLIKGVTLFLVGMIVLAMFGKLRVPGKARLAAAKCPSCGRFRIGKGDCPCGAGPGGGAKKTGRTGAPGTGTGRTKSGRDKGERG